MKGSFEIYNNQLGTDVVGLDKLIAAKGHDELDELVATKGHDELNELVVAVGQFAAEGQVATEGQVVAKGQVAAKGQDAAEGQVAAEGQFAAKGEDAAEDQVAANEANEAFVADDADGAVLYSLTKYSAIFAEVKGYFRITTPDNQLGQRSSCSLRIKSRYQLNNQLKIGERCQQSNIKLECSKSSWSKSCSHFEKFFQ